MRLYKLTPPRFVATAQTSPLTLLQNIRWLSFQPLYNDDSCETLSSEGLSPVQTEVRDAVKVAALIGAFRTRGHLCAKLDPLNRTKWGPWFTDVPPIPDRLSEQTLQNILDGYPVHGSMDDKAKYVGKQLDLAGSDSGNREFFIGCLMPGAGQSWQRHFWTLPEIIERMAECYCGTLAVETEHLATQEQRNWLVEQVELREKLRPEVQRRILKMLLRADMFEEFMAKKYPSSKRFGVEGCESVLAGLQTLIQHCGDHGVDKIEMGIAHRGRLNILCNILGKPLGAVCSEMEGQQSKFHVGDVKYHLGKSGAMHYTSEDQSVRRTVRLSVAPNPSHLEAISPVIPGMVRAKQKRLKDREKERVMGLLIHGDAAFCGLGIVAETLQLSDVAGFSTGGMVHIVINNQIGFTTQPQHGRSGPHATDVVKMIGAPVLHANADDPEAVYRACKIAADWRKQFKKDVVVDIVGYRRHGHNERDDPEPDLPRTYNIIKSHPRVAKSYSDTLQASGVITSKELEAWRQEIQSEFDREWEAAAQGVYKESTQQYLSSNWQGEALQEIYSEQGQIPFHQEPTGLPLTTVQFVGDQICSLPPDFEAHSEIKSLLDRRRKMINGPDSRVDWGMAEALAFGTLVLHRGVLPPNVSPSNYFTAAMGLNRGHYHVRLTGQDVERGTFGHRQSVLYDQKSAARVVRLNEIIPGQQDSVEVWNSPLSEAAVLGFEYGFSLGSKNRALVLWEAQFGDFSNNAQVVIDQFLASGECKWGQQSGLVLLLPHGYDGEGPDHSSARLERFLQMCNDDPDHLPGHSPEMRRQIQQAFEAASHEYGGTLNRGQALTFLRSLGIEGNGGGERELLDTLWSEMGLPENAPLTKEAWENFMMQYIRRNAERHTNMFVVNATTPAQFFHALRRQCNLPYKKPLIIMSPKYLLHHRPCTSALSDFATGTFFNRVIEDGKSSDNTRHQAVDPDTGEAYLLPASQIRRLILCSGQIFYLLSRSRRSREIRDVVLVRLEQICPFPHDLITRIVAQYQGAEIVWCQEEPKNMGAWQYVKPRMDIAMRQLCQKMETPSRRIRYVGRPVSASTATASFKIHQKETKEIVDDALSLRS